MIISNYALGATALETPASIITAGRMPSWNRTDPRWTLSQLTPMVDTQKYPSSGTNLGSATIARVLQRKANRRNFW
jgi:hypothetical protein